MEVPTRTFVNEKASRQADSDDGHFQICGIWQREFLDGRENRRLNRVVANVADEGFHTIELIERNAYDLTRLVFDAQNTNHPASSPSQLTHWQCRRGRNNAVAS